MKTPPSRSPRQRFALGLACALVFGACEGETTLVSAPAVPATEPPTPTSAAADAARPAAASTPAAALGAFPGEALPDGLTLESPGAEPRLLLSSNPPSNPPSNPSAEGRQALRLRVETRAGMGAVDGGRFVRMQTPAAEIDFAASPPGAGSETEGTLVLEAARSPSVAPRPEAPAPSAGLVSLVESGLVTLVGARGPLGAASASSAGPGRALAKFEPPAGASPASVELLDSVNEALGHFDLRRPDVPVGIGARWTERRSGTRDGVAFRLTRRVTLLRREGPRSVLGLELELAGATPATGGPGGGPPATMRGTGEGSVTVAPDRPFPVAGSLDLSLRTERADDGPKQSTMPGRFALLTEIHTTLVSR